MLYRTEPHSDKNAAYSLGFRTPQEAEFRTLIPVNVGLTTSIMPASEIAVAAAARCLAEGGLVGFPTETVYGLGADATNPAAIARLYEAKGRPSFNPLIAHVGDLKAARRIGVFDAQATALAEAFWPGPLTLVLPRTRDCAVADLATAGLDTVAIRVPAHPMARQILRAFGGPVVAPSANLSGHLRLASPASSAPVSVQFATSKIPLPVCACSPVTRTRADWVSAANSSASDRGTPNFVCTPAVRT